MKLSILALVTAVALSFAAGAQTSAPIRVDETKQVALHGSVNLLAQAKFDHGAVADDFPCNGRW